MAKTATYLALIAVAVGAFIMLLKVDGVNDMEWKEIRIGVWVAKLGLMKPLYDFLAIYGPEINTMNYGIATSGAEAPLEPPLRELDRYSVNLYNKCMRGTGASTAAIDGDTQLSVTEVGSGRGGGLYALRHIYPQHKFVGYDLSAPAIADANKRFAKENLVYEVGNALAIPSADCSQDVLVNVESSHNYPSLPTFFSEVNRVLKKGAHFGYADLMSTEVVEERVQMLKEAGFVVKYTENITAKVIENMESERHNNNKIDMVNEHYSKIPGWLQMVLPKKLFSNLAGVQGSPQYLHFKDGSESYMFWHLEGSGLNCK